MFLLYKFLCCLKLWHTGYVVNRHCLLVSVSASMSDMVSVWYVLKELTDFNETCRSQVPSMSSMFGKIRSWGCCDMTDWQGLCNIFWMRCQIWMKLAVGADFPSPYPEFVVLQNLGIFNEAAGIWLFDGYRVISFEGVDRFWWNLHRKLTSQVPRLSLMCGKICT